MLEAWRTRIQYRLTNSEGLSTCDAPDRSGWGTRNGRVTWHKSWLTRTPRVWRYIKHTPHNSWVAPTGQADPHRREGPPACDRQWQGLAGGDTTVTCVVASRRFKSGYFWRHMRGYGEAVRTLRRATRTWSPPDIPGHDLSGPAGAPAAKPLAVQPLRATSAAIAGPAGTLS